jgi:hypothetical protein
VLPARRRISRRELAAYGGQQSVYLDGGKWKAIRQNLMSLGTEKASGHWGGRQDQGSSDEKPGTLELYDLENDIGESNNVATKASGHRSGGRGPHQKRARALKGPPVQGFGRAGKRGMQISGKGEVEQASLFEPARLGEFRFPGLIRSTHHDRSPTRNRWLPF